MTIRKAYQDMIRVLGVPDTAMLMEMTESALDNRVYERKGQAFTVRESLRMQQISGTTRFAEEVAVASGGTFVKLPEVDHVDNESLLAKFNLLYAQVGELSSEFAADTKNGEIEPDERVRLEAIGKRLHRSVEELLALTFQVYCRDQAPGKAGQ